MFEDLRSLLLLGSGLPSTAEVLAKILIIRTGRRWISGMFATAVRCLLNKGKPSLPSELKPKVKSIEPRTPPEQTQTITRVIFDIVKEHGPLTITDTWEHIKGVGVRGLNSKRQMKILLRWMRERQKLRLICKRDGPHKQFLYTTWFTNPKIMPPR